MRRREFLGVLGGAASWPLAARAQQPGGVSRIGVLMNFAATDAAAQKAFSMWSGGDRTGWLGWLDSKRCISQ
jgi:putative tryptophan/tyrosine transport system substrate-binding protein